MNITKEEIEGRTVIKIEITEKSITWFEELYLYDEDSFFWADKDVTIWFIKSEEEE